MALGLFTELTKARFQSTRASAMGRWLMIEVNDEKSLQDVRQLLAIRMQKE